MSTPEEDAMHEAREIVQACGHVGPIATWLGPSVTYTFGACVPCIAAALTASPRKEST